jgi:hypothetical protein
MTALSGPGDARVEREDALINLGIAGIANHAGRHFGRPAQRVTKGFLVERFDQQQAGENPLVLSHPLFDLLRASFSPPEPFNYALLLARKPCSGAGTVSGSFPSLCTAARIAAMYP